MFHSKIKVWRWRLFHLDIHSLGLTRGGRLVLKWSMPFWVLIWACFVSMLYSQNTHASCAFVLLKYVYISKWCFCCTVEATGIRKQTFPLFFIIFFCHKYYDFKISYFSAIVDSTFYLQKKLICESLSLLRQCGFIC